MRHQEIARFLVQRGANVNAADEEGHSPLMIAARTGVAPNVELVLKSGANANAANRWGTTALMQACRSWNISAAKALLDAGADPDANDVLGKRALSYAKEKGVPPPFLVRLLKGESSNQIAGPTAGRTSGGDKPWWKFWEK
jgi:hypothetical protein